MWWDVFTEMPEKPLFVRNDQHAEHDFQITMTSQTFSPSARIHADSNPRDWAYELGCLPQTASIVFTKASLLAYLKTHGIEVGPNNAEISKIPRYAAIGVMTGESIVRKETATTSAVGSPVIQTVPAASKAAASDVEVALAPVRQTKEDAPPSSDVGEALPPAVPATVSQMSAAFRPSRRVREPIGGGSAQISALFGGGDVDDEESLREASQENLRRRGLLQDHNSTPASLHQHHHHQKLADAPAAAKEPENVDAYSAQAYRPSRRVREPGGTGGSSSITLG